ncbi:hypothetical protein HQ520_12975, partial [bacterium]|nr:hypothetical protein [bacterium]
MKVYSLFADRTACEVVLELCAPDPGGDPVRATVVGAEDSAIRTSAERAVKTGYFLLTKRGFDPSKLRFFASFDLNLPAGTPFSGDSAGVAFLVKFLSAVLEQASGRRYDNLSVAATGVIPEASADSRVAEVDGILEKLRAVETGQSADSPVLIPRRNFEHLQETGELVDLEPSTISRIRSVASVSDVIDWLDEVMPLEQHLPATTKIGYIAPPEESKPQVVGPKAGAAPRISRPAGAPLWLKRLALYSGAFLVGPVVLLLAVLTSGQERAIPGTVSDTPPAVIEAPELTSGSFCYGPLEETADGREAKQEDLVSMADPPPTLDLKSGDRVWFEALVFSGDVRLCVL